MFESSNRLQSFGTGYAPQRIEFAGFLDTCVHDFPVGGEVDRVVQRAVPRHIGKPGRKIGKSGGKDRFSSDLDKNALNNQGQIRPGHGFFGTKGMIRVQPYAFQVQSYDEIDVRRVQPALNVFDGHVGLGVSITNRDSEEFGQAQFMDQ